MVFRLKGNPRRKYILPILLIFSFCLYSCGDDETTGISGFYGKEAVVLVENGDTPVWSPDGETIVYMYGGSFWRISPDGGEPTQLASIEGTQSSPAWHPDPAANRIVFLSRISPDENAIQTLNIDSNEAELIYSSSSTLASPSISNDGSSIVFFIPGSKRGLSKIPADGSADPVAIANTDIWENLISARCSPATPQVAYIETRGQNDNLFTINLNGGKPTQVTNYVHTADHPNRMSFADWSRDGSQLAFVHSSNIWNSSSTGIYTVPAGGGEQKAWTDDPLDEYVYWKHPSFSPDGNRMVVAHSDQIWLLTLY